ncbi:MAG: exodeoxyribonuclease VII small subunit [Clostridia bacterium]|nr:exodeoxyribonuclease VII small subunit [Clostridia bacterium]
MDKKQNFEASLKELESVVKALEGNEVSLDEMLTLFERGIYLTKECTTALDTAEQKISVLMKNRDSGEIEEQPFAGLGE